MKHTKKKRVLAIVLCMILVLSTGIAAFANDNVGFQSVACSARTIEQVIKDTEGNQIGTLTAEIPEGAFKAASSDANIQMEVAADNGEAAVLDRVQSQLEADGQTGYTINDYMMADVTFYVNGEKQIPQQPITFTVKGAELDSEYAAAFADNRQDASTLMDVKATEDGGLQFTAEAPDAETIVYGVFEKEEAAAYEQTYENEQVKIKVSAAEGVVPDGTKLEVTPVVKTEVTENMSKEEKALVTEINEKYELTEKKLAEASETEGTEMFGFLAYDISLTDKDGNKVEPDGEVKVSMEYKEATIADEAVQAVENTDGLDSTADLDVSVIHLEEDEQGEVKNTVDLANEAVTSGSIKNLETDNEKKVEKVEFVSDSFSTFVITWKKDQSYGTNLVLKYVDTDGNELNAAQGNVTIENGNTDSIELSGYAKKITGYTYKEARLDSSDGSAIAYVRLKPLESGQSWNEERTPQVSSNGTEWTDVTKSSVIYLVYGSDNEIPDSDLEVAHQKYIKKNDSGNYDLTLNVAGEVESQTVQAKVDVLLIVDRSGSMGYDDYGEETNDKDKQRLTKLKTAVSGLVTDFNDKGIDAQYNLVSFAADAKNEKAGTWMDGSALTTAVNSLTANGGTNYDLAFQKVETPLSQARSDATKIVIFLTDGQPTVYGNSAEGLGNATNESTLNKALQSAAKIKCDKFYAVGFNLPTLIDNYYYYGLLGKKIYCGDTGKIFKDSFGYSGYHNPYITVNGEQVPNSNISGLQILQWVTDNVTANTSKEAKNLSSTDELSALFSSIVNSSLTFACSNVTITDTLSDYVQPTSESALNIRVMQKGTDSSGNTTYEEIVSKTGQAKGDADSIPSTSMTVDEATITASYNASDKRINLDFPDDYSLKENYYYYVTITNLEPTEAAYSEYKTSGYNAAGDKLTDASSDGNYAESGGTSSEQSGFYSNSAAKVTYTYKGTEKSVDYAKPVIQVTDSSIVKSKTAQVANWDDRTYNITLNVSSLVTETTLTDPVDVVFAFDRSASMYYRADLKYAKNGTVNNLDTSKVYYYVEDSALAKVYRVWYESGGGLWPSGVWKKIDDSKWDYNNNKVKSGSSSENMDYGTYDFYSDATGHDRFYYLKKAAEEFAEQIAEKSPESRIGLVSFASDATTDYSLSEMNAENLSHLKLKIEALKGSSNTSQDYGLQEAEKMLTQANETETTKHKQYVILLTDGCPNRNNGELSYDMIESAADSLKTDVTNADGANPTLMTVSVGLFDSNTNLKNAKDCMKRCASDEKYAFDAVNASSLENIFKSIFTTISKSTPIQQATVKDYIDDRFEVDENSVKSAGGTVNKDENGTYVIWNNQMIPAAGDDGSAGWTRTFQVKAKDTFIGGNAVTTNGSGSGVIIDGHLSEFEQPTVNVKSNIVLADKEVTIFKGDNVPTDEDILNQLFDKKEVTSYSNGQVGEADYNKMTVTWYTDEACTQQITKEEMKAATPEETTHYYVKVTFNAGTPTEDSNANTTVTDSDGSKEEKIDGTATITGEGDSTVTTYIYTAKTENGTDHGTYTVNVITGTIQITKNLTAAIDSETFTFVLKRQETDSSGNVTETVYPLVKNDDGTYSPAKEGDNSLSKMELSVSKTEDSGSTLTGTITITNLPRGFYTVSESDKTDYDIQTTVIGNNTNCFSNKDANGNAPGDVASFTIGNGKTDNNVIVKGSQNGSKTYYHDSNNGTGQLGVVIFTNEPVVSDWMIQKVSTSSSALKLSGAEFELKKKDSSVTYYGKSNDNGSVIWYTDQNRSAILTTKMSAGTYTLKETKAPAGYTVSIEEWTITLSKKGSIKTITSSTGSAITAVKTKGTEQINGTAVTKTISYYQFADAAVYELPHTGGPGIFLFTLSGMLLMGGAVWIMCKCRRREVLKR